MAPLTRMREPRGILEDGSRAVCGTAMHRSQLHAPCETRACMFVAQSVVVLLYPHFAVAWYPGSSSIVHFLSTCSLRLLNHRASLLSLPNRSPTPIHLRTRNAPCGLNFL